MDRIQAKVQFYEKHGINRETVAHNKVLVSLTLSHLGSRVTVGTLELHVRAFYDLMRLNASGS